MHQLYRPVRGAITLSANPDEHRYYATVRTAKNEHVLSATRGHIVLIERAEDYTFTIVVQHTPLMTVYRHITKPLKTQGAQVEAGDAIGVMDGRNELELEIWDAGAFVDPEKVIVW